MTKDQEIRNRVKKYRPISQSVNLFDPNLNDRSDRLYRFKDDNGNKFKIFIFTDRFKLETSITTSLLFSINIPDKICLANQLLNGISGIGRVYAQQSKDDRIQFCIKLLTNELNSLNLDPREGLTVYGNSLQLTLNHSRTILPEIEACIRVKTIIEKNYPDIANEIDYSDLPVDLRNIVEKFNDLAITDDFERELKIRELTKKQCSFLVAAIEPKLENINSFLDKFGGKPLTDGAIALQSLAELVVELNNKR